MTVCKTCGKENQDHYKFCLGCGAELSSGPAQRPNSGSVGTMKTMMADAGGGTTPPSGVPAGLGGPPHGAPPPGPPMGMPGPGPGTGVPQAGGPTPGTGPVPGPMGPAPAAPSFGGPMPAGPPPGVGAPPSGFAPQPGPPPAAAGPRTCPKCSTDVPPNFKFCGVCGFALEEAPTARSTSDIAKQPARQAQTRALLTLIRPDGTEGGTHDLSEGENKLGRNHGTIFESDGYLSPTHAELVVNAAGAVVRDLDSLNGVFVRMSEEEALEAGQIIRIGQELLRFDLIEPAAPLEDGTEVMGSPNPGYWGKITVILGKEVDGSAYPLIGDSVTVGRERGDINFPDDGYVSGLHARLTMRDGKVYLSDLGSSNGTFMKIQGEREIGNQSFVLLGQQLFRLNIR